jgi:hypothetical protein
VVVPPLRLNQIKKKSSLNVDFKEDFTKNTHHLKIHESLSTIICEQSMTERVKVNNKIVMSKRKDVIKDILIQDPTVFEYENIKNE